MTVAVSCSVSFLCLTNVQKQSQLNNFLYVPHCLCFYVKKKKTQFQQFEKSNEVMKCNEKAPGTKPSWAALSWNTEAEKHQYLVSFHYSTITMNLSVTGVLRTDTSWQNVFPPQHRHFPVSISWLHRHSPDRVCSEATSLLTNKLVLQGWRDWCPQTLPQQDI